MKLGIDTFDCDHGKSGQGSYVLSLVRNIPQCDDLEFELFGEEHDRYVYTKDNPIKYTSAEVKETASGQRFWHNFGFSRLSYTISYAITPSIRYLLYSSHANFFHSSNRYIL